MKNKLTAFIFCILFSSVELPTANACTNFSFATANGSAFHAQNYDWDVAHAMLIYNPSGLQKKGIGSNPPTWISKYPSLTFNQYGLEFPAGGMNDQGLAIGVMWLSFTTYPEADPAKPTIEPLQWVQYQLDSSSTVAEALELAKTLTVRPVLGASVPLHFLLSDASGDSAVIEFLNGEQLIYHGETLHASALTNSTYDSCTNMLSEYVSFGGNKPDPKSYDSNDRFIQMAVATKEAALLTDSVAAQEQAFRYLDQVKDPGRTVWSIVYNQADKRLSYKTLGNPSVRSIGFEAFSNDCTTRALALDVNDPAQNTEPLSLAPYTKGLNAQLMFKTFQETPHTVLISKQIVKGLAEYPFEFSCGTEPTKTSSVAK